MEMLEKRVVEAADLIVDLRRKVRDLEQEMLTHPAPPPLPSCPTDPSLVEELERLRAERVAVREIIRGLLREIDRVSR